MAGYEIKKKEHLENTESGISSGISKIKAAESGAKKKRSVINEMKAWNVDTEGVAGGYSRASLTKWKLTKKTNLRRTIT